MKIVEDPKLMSPVFKRVTDGDDVIVYRGWYNVNSPKWETATTAERLAEEKFRISRTTTDADGETITEWADGDLQYDNAWIGCESHDYSLINN